MAFFCLDKLYYMYSYTTARMRFMYITFQILILQGFNVPYLRNLRLSGT